MLTIPIAVLRGKILYARCSLFKHSKHPANPPIRTICLNIPSATTFLCPPTSATSGLEMSRDLRLTLRVASLSPLTAHAFVNCALRVKLRLQLSLPYFNNVALMPIFRASASLHLLMLLNLSHLSLSSMLQRSWMAESRSAVPAPTPTDKKESIAQELEITDRATVFESTVPVCVVARRARKLALCDSKRCTYY
ncbi:hypothetical protein FA15DRAFT_242466 [Coprinopsis marcescibilis]|uniref:Uncharacterized protein n=1 Tax=Coprinopsis marcescibilis TaxID=230819 RepID=A0A5C3KGL0_COPMA|nr:hypothetical protein FA15DRAFT_242466 [Coprinopsis marcescibilis]